MGYLISSGGVYLHFPPLPGQVASKIEIPAVLSGSLHSKRSTVDSKKKNPSGELNESDYNVFIDYNASNRLAMYSCCTSFPESMKNRSEFSKIKWHRKAKNSDFLGNVLK